jgi:hypothetical protein
VRIRDSERFYNRGARFYRLTREGQKRLAAETKDFETLIRNIQLVMRSV